MDNLLPATRERTDVFVYYTQHFCPILTKFGVSRYNLIQILGIKFHEIQPVGAALIQTDKWEYEANRRFSSLCERA
jgi:hypothetical protein